MKKIDKPIIDQEELCNSFKGLKYKEIIMDKSENYEVNLSNLEITYEKEKEIIQRDNEFKEYMKKMYSSRLSNKNYENIYKYYQQIRSSQRCCPYCNFQTREVKQLDHYLPKSIFPSLAIVVSNLVPICKDCNEKKDNYYSLNISKQLIHPYYDEKMDESFEFIKCEIIEEKNIGFRFHIERLEHWDAIFFEKVRFHFKKLEIDKLYLSDFNTEFDVFFQELKFIYECNKSKDILRGHIKMKVDVYYGMKIMPWRYAGFKSLLDSEWFIENNFK